jgi:hypothetical protein
MSDCSYSEEEGRFIFALARLCCIVASLNISLASETRRLPANHSSDQPWSLAAALPLSDVPYSLGVALGSQPAR